MTHHSIANYSPPMTSQTGTTTEAPAVLAPFALEVHWCAQRRSTRVTFRTEQAAIDFIARRAAQCAISEIESEPLNVDTHPRLLAALYPSCEHGLSLSNCYGPQHYWYDEEEQARGMRNS